MHVFSGSGQKNPDWAPMGLAGHGLGGPAEGSWIFGTKSVYGYVQI
jgi:hypothetical protein